MNMKNPVKFNHNKEKIHEAFGIKKEEMDELHKVITSILLTADGGRVSNLFESIIKGLSFQPGEAHYILLGYYFYQIKEKIESVHVLDQIKKQIVKVEQDDEKKDAGVINRLKELLN